jgi:hypothetical protein
VFEGIKVNTFYRSMPSPTTRRLGARLSPRRKLNAQRFLDYLHWHGRRLRLDDHAYADLRGDRWPAFGVDRYVVNQAVDDLYALGLVEIRFGGGVQVIVALSAEVEDAA